MITPEIRHWAASVLTELTDEQRTLVAACASSIIIGLADDEAPIAVTEADVRDHVVRLRDGTPRHLSPKLFALFRVLSDGERHDPSELYAALQLKHPKSGLLRENISRLRAIEAPPISRVWPVAALPSVCARLGSGFEALRCRCGRKLFRPAQSSERSAKHRMYRAYNPGKHRSNSVRRGS